MNCECVDRHVIGCRNIKEPFPKKAPKRLQARSEKRKTLAPVRAAFVEKKLTQDPFCQACPVIHHWLLDHPQEMPLKQRPRCTGHATTVHEPLTRARAPGDETILDEANAVSVCANGHAWVHLFPALSERMGLLKSSRGLTP